MEPWRQWESKVESPWAPTDRYWTHHTLDNLNEVHGRDSKSPCRLSHAKETIFWSKPNKKRIRVSGDFGQGKPKAKMFMPKSILVPKAKMFMPKSILVQRFLFGGLSLPVWRFPLGGISSCSRSIGIWWWIFSRFGFCKWMISSSLGGSMANDLVLDNKFKLDWKFKQIHSYIFNFYYEN